MTKGSSFAESTSIQKIVGSFWKRFENATNIQKLISSFGQFVSESPALTTNLTMKNL